MFKRKCPIVILSRHRPPPPSPHADARRGTVLILGNFRPTITLARRLSGLGYRVAMARGGGGVSESSRFIDEVWENPEPPDGPACFEALARHLRARPDIGIVVPLWEPFVLGLAHHRHLLPQDRLYATPDDEIVRTCLDKVGMLEVAAGAGVPSAPARTVATLEELRAAARAIGFPLVVRPLSSEAPIAGRKALIVRDAAAFDAALACWPEGHDRLIVQRFVRGPRYNVDFAAQRGRPIRMVATRILATNSHDGTGIDVHGRTEPLPADLRLYTERMLAHLGYHGVGLIQFMVDRARGEVSFLELNPRFNGNTAVPEAHGLDLVRLAVDLAAHPDRQEAELVSSGGLTHAWSFGALRGIAVSLRTGAMHPRELPGALWAALCAAVTADYHVMFRWSDPWPGPMQALRSAGAPGRALARWRSARLKGRRPGAVPDADAGSRPQQGAQPEIAG